MASPRVHFEWSFRSTRRFQLNFQDIPIRSLMNIQAVQRFLMGRIGFQPVQCLGTGWKPGLPLQSLTKIRVVQRLLVGSLLAAFVLLQAGCPDYSKLRPVPDYKNMTDSGE